MKGLRKKIIPIRSTVNLANFWRTRDIQKYDRTRTRTITFLKLNKNYITMLKITFGRLKKKLNEYVTLKFEYAKSSQDTL